MWTNAHHAVPNVPPPVGHSWKQQDETIVRTFFDGPISPKVLTELGCSCSGRNICNGKCECELNKLHVTEICPHQDDNKCKSELTQHLEENIVESEEDIEEAEEVFIDDIISSRELFQEVICECSGENMCGITCMCQSNGLTCTVVCPCEGKEGCHNGLTHII